MEENERFLLVELPRRLAPLIDGPPPGYRFFYEAVLNARIPAERNSSGYWCIREADVPAILAKLKLGLRPRQPAKAAEANPGVTAG